MSLQEFSYLADILGVVAVIASLIYVARQVRQNTAAIYAQSRQAVLTASQTEIFAEMDNPDVVTSILKSGPLTPEEQIRLNSWLFALMRAREFSWLQHGNGAIDDVQWQTEVGLIKFIFDSQRTRDWWNAIGRGPFGKGFAGFIDGVLDGQPATETSWHRVACWVPEVHSS
jgi:hypothetical protein